MKRLLLLALIFGFPSNALASAERERIENWFDDKYWYEEIGRPETDAACELEQLEKGIYNPEICRVKKNAKSIKFDADSSRAIWCEGFINSSFYGLENVRNSSDIKKDCKRIFNTYIYDPSFTFPFQPSYISFAIGEDLPFYKGKYKDGEKHGKATYYYKDGSIFNGKYKEGKKDGKGAYVWSDGEKYIGDWKDDKIDGKGTYLWSDGSQYIGDWKDDKLYGKGAFYYENGTQYIGDWKDDKKDGKGTYIFASGNKYIGDWKDDKKDGKGTFIWSDGDKYIGDWKDDNRHGKGTFYRKNGNKYIGDWKDDNRHGKGTYLTKTGEKFIGEFKNNNRHGQGIIYDKNKNIVGQGIWENDQFITSKVIDVKSLLSSKKSNNSSSNNRHKECLKAADYQGCMNYTQGSKVIPKDNNSENKYSKRNCVDYWCNVLPEEELDFFGMRMPQNYSYKIYEEGPEILYTSNNYFKLRVPEREDGRYLVKKLFARKYIPPKAGSPGYQSNSFNCYGNDGSMNCYSGLNLPGTPSQPGGVDIISFETVIDCQDRTDRGYWLEERQWVRKWEPLSENERSYELCNKDIQWRRSLKPSKLTKFEKRGIGKRDRNRRITGPDD